MTAVPGSKVGSLPASHAVRKLTGMSARSSLTPRAKIAHKSAHFLHESLRLHARDVNTTMPNSKQKLTGTGVARARAAGVALMTIGALATGNLCARDAGGRETERRDVSDRYFNVTAGLPQHERARRPRHWQRALHTRRRVG